MIIKRHNTLVVKNGFLTRFLTLFIFLRKVEIFFDDQIIVCSMTWFFFFNKTEVIGFTELSHIDFSGTQESDARQFVSYLSERLGISLGEQFDFSKLETNCQSCGRRISKSSLRCLYCGSKIRKNTQPMC